MKLISMTDFVLGTESDLDKHNPVGLVYNIQKRYVSIIKYAKFLKQPLKLEMFVPCDYDGNYWKYPPTQDEWEWAQKDSSDAEQSFKQKEFYYQKVKEKVLFEGFTVLTEEDDVIELVCKDIFINYNKEEDLFSLDSWNGDALIMDIECLTNLINHTANNIILTQNAIKQFM